MIDFNELQRRFLGAAMSMPAWAMTSRIAGRFAAHTTGKWRTLAVHIDSLVVAGKEPSTEAITAIIIADPYDGPTDCQILPETAAEAPWTRSEDTCRGYERQIIDWNSQKRAVEMLRATALKIMPDSKILDPGPELAALCESLRAMDTGSGGDVNLGRGLHEAVVEAERTRDNAKAGRRAASWGLAELDRICPLDPGRMVILAAAPKCGKTSLAMQAASATSDDGGRIAFASMEMPASELATIMASRVLGFSVRDFRQGLLGEGALLNIKSLADEWKANDNVIIRDTRAENSRCMDIVSWCKMRVRMFPDTSLIIVDYLQLLSPSSDRQSEYETVTKASRSLKQLAVQTNLPVLVLSQMNREGRKQKQDYGRNSGQVEPTVGSLRSSGAIEQDADAVCFLWSEQEPNMEEKYRPVQFKMAVSRYAEPGKQDLMFYGPNQIFSVAEPKHASAEHQRERLKQAPNKSEDLFNPDA